MARFWSWFDWNAIDGVVDGIARSVRGLGSLGRRLQSGWLQASLFYAASAVAIILIVYVLN